MQRRGDTNKPIIKSINRLEKRAAEIHQVTEQYFRFDQRKTVFGRPISGENMKRMEETRRNHLMKGDEGFSLADFALKNAAYTAAKATRSHTGIINSGFYSWDPLIEKEGNADRFHVDPSEATRIVKKAAGHYGADLAGATILDRRWVYSHDRLGRSILFEDVEDWYQTDKKIVIPCSHSYVVVMALEMSWDLIRYAPNAIANAATQLGYSGMAVLSASVAEFLRELGWHAIPCGNDTALSVPLAIDAGLGQQGRYGRLITPKFGPRVRICKVLTDMPLTPDSPIDFGVTEFCEQCTICADECPAGAIAKGPRTFRGPAESNNNGTLKWYSNPDKCMRYWGEIGTSCAICLKVCPYSQIGKDTENLEWNRRFL